jgi:phosphoglycolate phosphatase
LKKDEKTIEFGKIIIMLPMLKAIIFDFDGVIGDTYDTGFMISKMFDHDITEQDFRDHHNGNVFESPKINFQPEDVPLYYAKQKELFTQKHIFPIHDYVQSLSQQYSLFIVSSSLDENIRHFLQIGKMDNSFNQILGCTTHKSKIEKFKMIFETYDLKSEECIFVTDTIGDIKEGRYFDLKTIAVTWGYHSRELLESEKPFATVDTPLELFETIHTIANEAPI